MSDKKLKIAIVSSKGGVGKSTIAMQLVAPYLYEKNNHQPIAYYEADDDNSDRLSFGGSSLTKRESIEVFTPLLRDNLTDIFATNETTCLDIGGNKTTNTVIEALNDSGMIHFLDLVVIPLLDGEQDSINATIVYSLMKGYNSKLKFIFVLNRAQSHKYVKYQFENYFGDVRGIFQDVYSLKHYLFEEDKNRYAVMVEHDIIKYSRRFGLTTYEIALQERDFISELKLNMSEMSQEQEVRLLSFKNYVSKSAKSYHEDVLQLAFKELDKVLQGEKNES
ncbi:MAG: ParA family protein [Campylobacterota bacterium]|nr:ParA family protein [Campylobacterota bacterium]